MSGAECEHRPTRFGVGPVPKVIEVPFRPYAGTGVSYPLFRHITRCQTTVAKVSRTSRERFLPQLFRAGPDASSDPAQQNLFLKETPSYVVKKLFVLALRSLLFLIPAQIRCLVIFGELFWVGHNPLAQVLLFTVGGKEGLVQHRPQLGGAAVFVQPISTIPGQRFWRQTLERLILPIMLPTISSALARAGEGYRKFCHR